MSSIQIIKKGITKLEVEAIVNAANSHLLAGGGVCGAIFKDAGYSQLATACDKIGHCDTGSAVITPGFNLKAKYIIHAVGPIWNGGNNDEPKKLYDCYLRSLELARENGCHSIAFPLISSGIFGYPKDKAWRKALQACQDFLKNNEDYDIDICFAVLDDSVLELGEKTMQDLGITNSSGAKKEFCKKYVALLQTIDWDDELKEWCHQYSVYEPVKEHKGLEHMLYGAFMREAYDAGVIVHDYHEIIETGNLDERLVAQPTDEFIESLSDAQILGCIAWHFRRDHFSEGSLIAKSIADGYLLKYIKTYIER